jgi:hypothetical protein
MQARVQGDGGNRTRASPHAADHGALASALRQTLLAKPPSTAGPTSQYPG